MDKGTITIGFSIVVFTILIYVVKNNQNILNFFNLNKNKNIFKIIVTIITVLIILFLTGLIIKYTELTMKNVKWYINSLENDKTNEEYDKKMIEENQFYKIAMEKEYVHQNYNNPYIPENFSYVEGQWNTGFVIQDNYQNQYVWVPCTNKENDEIPLLQRKNFTEDPFIPKEMCTNEKYKEFINSCLENGGFYISRFEIGKEDENVVSKKDVEVLTNLKKEDVIENINKFNYNINCELINGYAYDTTLEWILKTNQVEQTNNNVKETIISGKKSYNNIYDFFDNTLEITNETNYGTVIIRGAFLEDQEGESYGFSINNFDRISILENENNFSDGTKLGFRTIIYK